MKEELKDFINILDNEFSLFGKIFTLFLVGSVILFFGLLAFIIIVGVFLSPTSLIFTVLPLVLGYSFYYFGKKWINSGGKH